MREVAPAAPVVPPPSAQASMAAAAAQAIAVRAVVDEEPADLDASWRAVVAELKAQKKDMLASALAHGRVIGMAGASVRLGYAPQDGMFRRQVERAQKDAEAVLSKVLGRAAGLVLEMVSAEEAGPSLAEQETVRVKAREDKLTRQARESPQVLAAMRILGGTVEQIKVLDEEETFEPALAPEEPEEEKEET